jgi:hypothetical protein
VGVSLVPTIGPAFGAASIMFGAAAALVPPGTGDVPASSQYSFTLNQLKDSSSLVGMSLANSTNRLFQGIVNDWGKLSVIGSGYGSHSTPWYMCTNCNGANVPEAAVPAFALGAKRSFYLQLLPTVYSSDFFLDRSDSSPASISRLVTTLGNPRCFHPYSMAPSSATGSYPNGNNPSNWDTYTITQTQMTKVDFSTFSSLSFPSSALLNDLFGAPNLGGLAPNPPLSGGSGLTMDQLLPTGGYLGARAGYLPGVSSSSCR